MDVRSGPFRLPSVRATAVISGALCLAGLSACDSNPPTTPSPQVPTPSSLAVVCNATALGSVGQQTQCSARVTMSDSTIRDQTGTAQWTSSDSSRVSVTAGGLVTAVAPGNAEVSAAIQGLTGRQAIAVTVACTFSIAPAAVSFPSSGGTQTVTVQAAPSGCSPSAWTAVASDAGLTITPPSGEGNGSVTVTAAANSGGDATRRATVAGQTLTVALGAAPPPPPPPPPPGPTMRTLTLTLLEGEQLSGPYEGTVTGPGGYECTLDRTNPAPVRCRPIVVADGTTVDLKVELLPQYANLGTPISRTTGCDARFQNFCRVVMNADRSVTIGIGCAVSCASDRAVDAFSTSRRTRLRDTESAVQAPVSDTRKAVAASFYRASAAPLPSGFARWASFRRTRDP